jgi:hypothetical protein
MARHASPATQARPERADASRTVAGFISKFDPAVARVIRSSRAALRKRYPTAIELVYDNYNALAIGWSGTERTSDAFISLAAYARGVVLYFLYGKSLPDPEGILQGSGNRGRFVRLPSAATLGERAVQALLRAAVKQAKAPLPKTGRGYTVIKSISAKQRPRRAARPSRPSRA